MILWPFRYSASGDWGNMRPFVVLSMRQIASAIGKAIGKTVTYVPVTTEAARQSMAQMGMDDWMVNVMCDDFAAYSDN